MSTGGILARVQELKHAIQSCTEALQEVTAKRLGTQPSKAITVDDVSGSGALDRPLTITLFDDAKAASKRRVTITVRKVAPRIALRTAPMKEALPWLKLATFGEVKTPRGSLRHNANMLSIDGIEGDYDGEVMSIDEAKARLERARLAALVYTSPSHTAAKPRWRVLCPTSAPLPPGERAGLVARLNGILGGMLGGESFNLSQGFYYGRVGLNPDHRVELIEGRYIDQADDLAAGAVGRDGSPYSATAAAPESSDLDDDDDLRGEPDWTRIKSALDAIPATARDDRETYWRPIGMALHAETEGSDEGFELWDEWSRASGKYNGADQRRVWESFGTRREKLLRIGSLYSLAKQHGWTGRQQPKAGPPSRLTFLSPAECAAAPSRGYVVKGILAPCDVGCIYGAPGTGKSLIAPHIAYMVARGEPAFGMRTRPGGVFYVAAEDPHGMRGRVTALRMTHGDAPSFTLVEGVSDLLADDSPDLAALAAELQGRRPSLIFIDTLAMSFPGLEENTAEGMGKVVAVARSLTVHGAAVVLIHHDTKAEGSTPRGHSLLNGALDMALQLLGKDEHGIVRGRFTKNRNGICHRDIAFRIATRELGTDEDGDPITTAVVDELAPNTAPKREKLSPGEAAALDALQELISKEGTAQPDGRMAVTEERWRRECSSGRRVSSSDNAESRRKALQRALKGLLKKRRVEIRDEWAGITGSAPVVDDDFADVFKYTDALEEVPV